MKNSSVSRLRLRGLVIICATLAATAVLVAFTQFNPPNWGIDRIDQRTGLDNRFDYTLTGAGVNVYVIDTGVRITHQDFGGRAQYIGDFYSGGPDASDCELGTHGHGTHQASLSAGSIYGVAKGANIWALRAAGGPDCQGDVDATIRAVQWITANGRRPAVVNLSFRFQSGALQQAILQSIAAGFTYTLSAGCAGDVTNIWGPDVANQALIVGGTDTLDSSDQSGGLYGGGLALFAPARGLRVAGNDNDTYEYLTPSNCVDSYAAPHVAGVAATYLQFNPGATPNVVKQALVRAATPNVVTNPGTSPNRLLYSCPAGFGQAPAASLGSGQALGPDQAVYSEDGRFRLLYQLDGNLVLYRVADGLALWASNTVGTSPGNAIMQGDGNFVVYDAGGTPRWASNTPGYPGAYLVVQNDGNTVIYDTCGIPIWDTATAGF